MLTGAKAASARAAHNAEYASCSACVSRGFFSRRASRPSIFSASGWSRSRVSRYRNASALASMGTTVTPARRKYAASVGTDRYGAVGSHAGGYRSATVATTTPAYGADRRRQSLGRRQSRHDQRRDRRKERQSDDGVGGV